MDEPPILLAVLIAKGENTYAEIVEGFRDCAREHGEDAEITERTLRRWMSGDIRQPRPAQRRVAWVFRFRVDDESMRERGAVMITTGRNMHPSGMFQHGNSAGRPTPAAAWARRGGGDASSGAKVRLKRA